MRQVSSSRRRIGATTAIRDIHVTRSSTSSADNLSVNGPIEYRFFELYSKALHVQKKKELDKKRTIHKRVIAETMTPFEVIEARSSIFRKDHDWYRFMWKLREASTACSFHTFNGLPFIALQQLSRT